MNREILETQWPQVREILAEKFSNLSEEDIRQINGRYDQLVSKLQQKYGYSREEAEERIRSWNFDRASFEKGSYERGNFEKPYKNQPFREERASREEDHSPVLKWVLGLGIPLLLLGAYFLSTERAPEATRSPTTTQQQMGIESPADRAITTGLRNALFSQPSLASDLQNIQITANNGVVTLSGRVPSNEVRDSVVSAARNFSGVRQVVNNLQVR